MHREHLLALLRTYKAGESNEDSVADALSNLLFEDLGYAKIDHNRTLRCGMPEVIYAEGKTPDQVANIFLRMSKSKVPVLATRASADHAQAVQQTVPLARYHALARCITLAADGGPSGATVPPSSLIAIACGGTSDIPIAEEAALTAELFGAEVKRVYDIGVAGLHRLLDNLPILRQADVIVACAGMEGALPSVLGGLVAVPVIAVPTSVGYGANLQGVAALLGMLNSCSPNIAVVNIDNGFGAGYLACLISGKQRR